MSLSKWLVSIAITDWKIISASNNNNIMKKHLELLKEQYKGKFSEKIL